MDTTATELSHAGVASAGWHAALRSLPRWNTEDLRCDRFVVVAPHPDDETLGVGGTIGQMVRESIPVHIVSVTDGEAAATDRTNLGSRRLFELHRALQVLAPRDSISTTRCGLPDGRVAEEQQELRAMLETEIRVGDFVTAPMLNDGHSDHDVVGRVVRDVARDRGVRFGLFPIWAWQWHSPDSSEIMTRGRRIEISAECRIAKAVALDCFESQILGDVPVLSKRFLQRFYASFEVIVAEEPTP